MRLVADENIPLLDEFFGDIAEIRRLPGRAICREDLLDADALLVRSVTRVDQALLQGTPVKFVGTCTIGTDHLELPALEAAGIRWSSAPGCNARGVVDYVLGAIWTLAERTGLDPAGRTYGVVGAGQVGGRLVDVLRGLGWQVLVCDPPRQQREGGDFVALEDVLARCDVISLHTPLAAAGEHPTRHLLGASELAALREGSWLINASRGAVIDNLALRRHLQAGSSLRVVLDVWEGEPQVDVELAALCDLATPHIAGYSLDGKQRGTEQIYQAFCRWADLPAQVRLADLLPASWLSEIALQGGAPAEVLPVLARAVYDPRRDDADFRRSLQGDAGMRAQAFDALRKHYPVRRELTGLRVALPAHAGKLQVALQALGMQIRLLD